MTHRISPGVLAVSKNAKLRGSRSKAFWISIVGVVLMLIVTPIVFWVVAEANAQLEYREWSTEEREWVRGYVKVRDYDTGLIAGGFVFFTGFLVFVYGSRLWSKYVESTYQAD